jgi:hypothetical protein
MNQQSIDPNNLIAFLNVIKRFNAEIGNFVHFTSSTGAQVRIHLDNGFLDAQTTEIEDALNGRYTDAQLVQLSLRFKRMGSVSLEKSNFKFRKILKPILIFLGIILLVIGGLFVGLVIYSIPSDSGEVGENYKELLLELEEQEAKHPVSFISATGSFYKRYWESEGYLSCSLTSSALKASYNDIGLRVNFLSKTKTIIETREFVVYEYLEPGKTIQAEIKVDKASDEVDSIELIIISAVTAQKTQ